MIAHVDMDAFYVSVELLRRPELRGKPVVVATGDDPTARGVVMTASYEARKFGVHSALPLAVAHRRCPQMVLVPRDMQLYQRASKAVYEVLNEFSDRIEPAGMDEAYLDLSGSRTPKTRARELKRRVLEDTHLVCSVGLAENKLLAKIASDLEKPDGLCLLRRERMLEAVGERPASLLPGVGPRSFERLEALGIKTVADLAGSDPALLESTFGPRSGRSLHDRANGIDNRGLVTERRPKSESRETTFAVDVDDRERLRETLARLTTSVCEGLARGGYAGRTVTLKLRLRPFRTYTRSRTIEAPTREAEVVGRVAAELLERFELDAPVRLIGVGVAGLIADDPRAQGDPAAGESSPAAGPLTLNI